MRTIERLCRDLGFDARDELNLREFIRLRRIEETDPEMLVAISMFRVDKSLRTQTEAFNALAQKLENILGFLEKKA